jgi:hypothetical protein
MPRLVGVDADTSPSRVPDRIGGCAGGGVTARAHPGNGGPSEAPQGRMRVAQRFNTGILGVGEHKSRRDD